MTAAALLLACSEKEPAPDAGSGNGGNGGGDTPKETGWFISPDGSDENSGKAPVFPFKTFDKVLSVIRPGDVVNIMPGRYEASEAPVIDLGQEHSGRDGEYITFRAYDADNRPVLYGYGRNVWNIVRVNASYIILDGLEVVGNSSAISKDEAYDNAYKYWDITYNGGSGTMDWAQTALYNTNGISIGQDSGGIDHVIVRNCVVHDVPGGGIGGQEVDWLTIEDNVIYNNCWRNQYGCSGISVMGQYNSDANTEDYKIIVRGNICYNNRNEIPWANANFKLSDGNGIIMDVNNAEDQITGPYKGRTLVCNNISFCNGGSGIHSFKANNVDIINNTAYCNSQMYDDGNWAEIFSNQCLNVNIVNNIMYAKDGGVCNTVPANPDSEIYENNLYFGTVRTMGTNGKIADPKFVNPTTDPLSADFHLAADSPAIGAGAFKEYMPDTDKDGVERGGRIDAGAYQYVE